MPVLVGVVAGMAGDSLMLLVFGIWIKALTGSSGAAGLVMLFVALPAVLLPFAGAFVDRFRRRQFLVWVNALSVVTVAPLFFVDGPGDLWIIYLCATLYGVSSLAVTAALNGLLKLLVPTESLAKVNGRLRTIREALRLLGPLVGAALFAAVGGWMVAALDAASFVVAAVAISRVRVTESRPVREPMSGGLRLVLADNVLRRVALIGGVAMLVIGMIEAVSFAIVGEGLGRPPEFMGVFVTAQGVGAIGGGLFAAIVVTRLGELRAMAAGFAAFGVGAAVCASSAEVVVLGGVAIVGAGLVVTLVAMTTVIQRRSSSTVVGRTTVAMEAVHGAPHVVSIGLGAALVGAFDYRVLLGIVLIVLVGVAVVLAGRPSTCDRTTSKPLVTRR